MKNEKHSGRARTEIQPYPKLKEEWRAIFRYTGFYEVSNQGKVRSINRWVTHSNGKVCFYYGRILRPSTYSEYEMVTLQREGDAHYASVARLVAKAFLPNPRRLPQINHKDGEKLNNVIANLEWCTHQHNSIHARAVLGKCKNETHGMAKLTITKVKELRQIRVVWGVISRLAKSYRVHRATITRAILGRTWKGI